MNSLRRAMVGALLGTALAGSALAAPSGPGQVCYFGECGPGASAPAAPATPSAPAATPSAPAPTPLPPAVTQNGPAGMPKGSGPAATATAPSGMPNGSAGLPTTPASLPTAACPARTVAEFGSWIACASDKSVMVKDRFKDGSYFALLKIKDGGTVLVLHDPAWNLNEGNRVAVKIDVDGDVYNANLVALNATTLSFENVGKDFLRSFYRGQKAVITVGNDRWEMTLANAAKAIDALVAEEDQLR
jgi:hypothetical protein